jgi:pimeloyl-ACP methyl ester carboxylesterase
MRPPISRRKLMKLLALSSAGAALSRAQSSTPRPFRVAIAKHQIDRILARVRQTEWPDPIGEPGWAYGVSYSYLKELSAYWTTRFDWRKVEERLNRYPQFLARVDDFDIHFLHVRGTGVRPMPIVLTHGWPGSVIEFLDAIGPLTDPVKYGGSAADAFDVVIPSLPGFGFSSKPKGKPVGPVTTARLWHKLMTEVSGYTRYGAQGGDWGNAVTVQLAAQFPGELIGIHLNAVGARPVPEAERSEEERAWLRDSAAYRQAELDYFNEQQHKPQTVAFALADNPLGTAAWIVEKLKSWSDSGDDLDSALSKDQVLADVMWYLVTRTEGSSVWFYRGNADEPAAPRGKISVPTGFAAFPKEMRSLAPPRSMLERDFNLVHYTKMPRGGHFACFEQPQLFVDDLRVFFRRFRT